MNNWGRIQNRRVLIIDDNPAIHEDFRKILGGGSLDDSAVDAAAEAMFGESPTPVASIRFEIDSAMQGRQGLERVKEAINEGRPYAMAFVDGRMPPGWDGVETITRIWEVYPDLQVVMCTAYSDYSWDDLIAKIGQSDRLVILKKPFDTVEALQLANTLTAKWALSQEVKSRIDRLEHSLSENSATLSKSREQFRLASVNLAHEINTSAKRIEESTRVLEGAFKGLVGNLEVLAPQNPQQRLLQVREHMDFPVEKITPSNPVALSQQIAKAIQQSLEGVAHITQLAHDLELISNLSLADGSHANSSTPSVHALDGVAGVDPRSSLDFASAPKEFRSP